MPSKVPKIHQLKEITMPRRGHFYRAKEGDISNVL